MFLLNTAFKYLFSKCKGQKSNTFTSIIGIALSIMAVIVVSSVMNGLQDDQLTKLREIESFDLIVEETSLNPVDISALSDVDYAFKFFDTAILINDKTSGLSVISKLRAVDPDLFSYIKFNKNFSFMTDNNALNNGLLISYSMLNNLDYGTDDKILLTILQKGKTATLAPKNIALNNIGIFGSKLQSFNQSTVLMSFDYAKQIINTDNFSIGIYSDNVKETSKQILKLDPNAKIKTWQESNQITYSALILEKALVYLFLGLLFIILGVNLKNSISRFINYKTKECGILRAIGLEKKSVLKVFLYQGTTVTLIGEIIGLFLGILFVQNIQDIFSFIDYISYLIIGNSANLSQLSYYVSTKPLEVLFMLIIVFILSLIFTFFGCRKLFKKEIMEEILNVSY